MDWHFERADGDNFSCSGKDVASNEVSLNKNARVLLDNFSGVTVKELQDEATAI